MTRAFLAWLLGYWLASAGPPHPIPAPSRKSRRAERRATRRRYARGLLRSWKGDPRRVGHTATLRRGVRRKAFRSAAVRDLALLRKATT